MSSCFVVDLDARPWDFQAEECALRANIERFNARRYDRAHSNPDFLPVDNCLQSVLGQRVDLPEDFQMNYDLWLEREVFSKPNPREDLQDFFPRYTGKVRSKGKHQSYRERGYTAVHVGLLKESQEDSTLL